MLSKNYVMSILLDIQKTKLLKTKTFDFSINNKHFSSNYTVANNSYRFWADLVIDGYV